MKHVLALALLAACGNDLHHTVDALPADAPGDTLVPSGNDPPANAVKLAVRRGTGAVPDVAVYFQDPSSAVIEQALTNESGLAWALMPDGGFVTAVEHVGDGLDEITTFSAVAPADALRLDFMDPGQRKEWPIKLSFPFDAGGTAASYLVHTSCNSETIGLATPIPVAADDNQITLSGCDDGFADFAIESFDVDGNSTGRALYAAAVALPAPQPPTGAGTTFVPLQLTGAFNALEVHTLDYVNVSEAVGSLGILHGISADRRTYEVTDSKPRAGASISTTISVPAGAMTMLTATVGYPASSAANDQQLLLDWGPASTAYTLDAAQSYLPGYNTAPSYDVASRTVTWVEGTAPIQPDLVRARIHVYRDDIPSGRSWGWRIVAPRTATAAVAFPQLPILGFDFNPADGDVVGVDELTNVKLPGGYATWRARAFTDVTRAVSGSSGKIFVETLYVPEL
jgi:hypothetical protein